MSDLLTRLQTALGDRYRVERELGVSGLGRLFHATDPRDGRQVTILMLPPAVAARLDAARFREALDHVARVRHPHLSTPLDGDVVSGLAWCAYPYRPGETLREKLGRSGRLPPDVALSLLTQIADALAPAHAVGLAHGDLRPECVQLDGTRVTVAEFGLGHVVRAAATAPDPELRAGAAGYAAPEQEAGASGDARADVYALGVIGYEMLAGFPPFAGPTAAAVVAARLTGTPEPLDMLRLDVSPASSAVITTALARDPAKRFADATEFRAALHGRRPRRRRIGAGALLGAGLVLVLAALVLSRARGRPTIDPDLVVVAPFDVLAPEQELWREGMVDVLSRNLDGAGPLRTVSPTVAVRRWSGRVDAGPAAALARRTGAGLAVFGRLLPAGDDSVRVVAALVAAPTRTVLAEFEFRARSDHVDQLTDSLTVALLAELGRTRPLGAVRRTGLTVVPLPALKAFLQGEQHFRRAAWDSAITAYERAIAAAPDFALALRRLSLTFGWQRSGDDSLGQVYAFRGGAANHGYAPRESLLILAESLNAALFEYTEEPQWWPLSRRLFAALDEAARRYPEDPEVWYEAGEARFHFGYWHGIGPADALRAFDRSIELDSAFAPAYIHPVELALTLHGPAAAQRYATAYAAGPSGGAKGSGIPLVARLLRDAGRRSDLDALLDTVSTEAIHNAWLTLTRWADSAETATRLIQYLARQRRGEMPMSEDTIVNNLLVAAQLTLRGHVRAAHAVAGGRSTTLTVEGTLAGVVPAESARATFRQWLAAGRLVPATAALPFWEATADTAALKAFRASLTAAALPHERLRLYLAERAAAGLALARRDTAEALRRFTALPESLCGGCQATLAQARLVTAQLLGARGRDQEALRLLEPDLAGLVRALAVFTVLQRAQSNERLGRVEEALADFRYVADVWRGADAELQPYVAEARAAIRRLTEEGR
jgi:serine/threonine-protein kinase